MKKKKYVIMRIAGGQMFEHEDIVKIVDTKVKEACSEREALEAYFRQYTHLVGARKEVDRATVVRGGLIHTEDCINTIVSEVN